MHQDAVWYFHCPTCGLGDEELGLLARADEIHCQVCWEESATTVRLERWTDPHQARFRDDLAA